MRDEDHASEPGPTGGLAAVPDAVVRLKVVLRGTKPPVWRRIEVPASTTLADLHHVLQAVMGWTSSHLHEFEVAGRRYGDPRLLEDPHVVRAGQVRLRDVVERERRFRYVYDFGDDWVHDLSVEEVHAPEAGASYPRCMAGRRARPPEDCGGPGGYAGLLEALRDPDHPEHADALACAGQGFDPERFDEHEAGALLSAMAEAATHRARR